MRKRAGFVYGSVESNCNMCEINRSSITWSSWLLLSFLRSWFGNTIYVGHAEIFTTMARPPHQRRPCRNIYYHGATASSTSSMCRSTNMVLTASLTSHMWESITLVATVPLKLSHVKYNHRNNRLINVVHAEYIRIITKFTVWLPHLHRRCTTLFLIKEFVYQKEQRHALSIV